MPKEKVSESMGGGEKKAKGSIKGIIFKVVKKINGKRKETANAYENQKKAQQEGFYPH
jgi:hypothetical protein